MEIGDWIEYPGHDKAWIGWETTSSYLIYRIKNVLNEGGKTSQTWLYKQLELEWVLKTDFNYKTINNEKKRKKISQ
jgi:hypothetical protein